MRSVFSLIISLGIILYGVLFLHKDFHFKQFINSTQIDSTLEELTHHFHEIQLNRLPVYPFKTAYFEFRLEIERRRFLTAYDMGLRLHKLAPGFYDLEWHIAFLCTKLLRTDEALSWLERAIDFHPLEENNYVLKAQILETLDRQDEALTAMETARNLKLRNNHFKENSQKI